MLHPLDLPEPHAGDGQVRIRIHAAAINPVDAIIRSGAFAGMEADAAHPIVPGMDVAGVIDEIGPEQPDGFDLAVGDPAIGFVVPSGPHGGYSEQIALPTQSVTRMPSNVDFAAGASFLSNALTAELTLEALALPSGSTFAVTGAAGAVGGYLVELVLWPDRFTDFCGHAAVGRGRPPQRMCFSLRTRARSRRWAASTSGWRA